MNKVTFLKEVLKEVEKQAVSTNTVESACALIAAQRALIAALTEKEAA